MDAPNSKDIHRITILASRTDWEKIKHEAINRKIKTYQLTNILIDEGFKVLEQRKLLEQNEQK
jgi:hypothetical protein